MGPPRGSKIPLERTQEISTRRLELDYVAPVRRPHWPGLVVLAVSLAVAGAMLVRYRDAQREVVRLEAESGLIAPDRRPARAVSRERLEEEAKLAEGVVRQLTLPWAKLIGAIEQAPARAHAPSAGVLGRARRRAAPLLQPVPAGLRADRRRRAPPSPCAQLGPRSRPGRVPPRAPRRRPVGLPRDAARARQLCAAARLPRRAAHQHADRVDRRAALRAQEGGRHAARSPGAGDAARAAFRRNAMTR